MTSYTPSNMRSSSRRLIGGAAPSPQVHATSKSHPKHENTPKPHPSTQYPYLQLKHVVTHHARSKHSHLHPFTLTTDVHTPKVDAAKSPTTAPFWKTQTRHTRMNYLSSTGRSIRGGHARRRGRAYLKKSWIIPKEATKG